MATKPAIARIWRGRTTRARADEYAKYLYEVGIRPLEEKALAVMQLREDREHETEFVTISYWASVEAMAVFTGEKRNASVITSEPSTVMLIPKDQFLSLTQSNPKIAHSLIESMARRIDLLNEQIIQLSSPTSQAETQ